MYVERKRDSVCGCREGKRNRDSVCIEKERVCALKMRDRECVCV